MKQFLLGLSLVASLAPSAPPSQDPGSTITGTVLFKGTHKPRKLNDQIDKDRHGGTPRQGRDVYDEEVLAGPKGELANVLVRVTGKVPGEFPAPMGRVEVAAIGYFFKPRVAVVRAGQTLRVKNSGLDRCNFSFKPRRNRAFNVNLVRDHSEDVELSLAETAVPLRHGCLPWMVAWIHVLEHPFFAVTGADGSFRIQELPAGTYEIEAWHEKFGVRKETVTLGNKESKALNFVFE